MQPQEMGQSQSQFKKRPSFSDSLVRLLIFISIIAALGLAFANRQNIVDQIVAANYVPTSDTLAMVDRLKLTETGMFYIKASKTEINSSEAFNSNCQRKEAKSIILGCYSSMRIFVYDVKNDERLKGVMSVTTAHELLHAAWDRLPEVEKNKLTTLLQNEYKANKTSELVERMQYYERQQPGDEAVELHSIIGTEFKTIDQELESYYKRYFLDRSLVVSMHENYSNIFADLTEKQNQLKLEIDQLVETLNYEINSYNTQVTYINTQSDYLLNQRSSIDLSDSSAVNQFNAELVLLQAKIDDTEAYIQKINSSRSLYESKITEYNNLVVIGNDLTANLDSTLIPSVDCTLFESACRLD